MQQKINFLLPYYQLCWQTQKGETLSYFLAITIPCHRPTCIRTLLLQLLNTHLYMHKQNMKIFWIPSLPILNRRAWLRLPLPLCDAVIVISTGFEKRVMMIWGPGSTGDNGNYIYGSKQNQSVDRTAKGQDDGNGIAFISSFLIHQHLELVGWSQPSYRVYFSLIGQTLSKL